MILLRRMDSEIRVGTVGGNEACTMDIEAVVGEELDMPAWKGTALAKAARICQSRPH